MKNNPFVRGLAVFLCLAMILGFVPGGILNVNAAENDAPVSLVPNGNFEKLSADWKNAGWTPMGTAYVLYDAERDSMVAKVEDLSTHTYDEEGNIVQRGTGSEIASDKFAVAAGVAYNFSFWYKWDEAVVELATSTKLPVSILWYDADGNLLDTNGKLEDGEYYTAFGPALSTEWQKFEAAVVVPNGAVTAHLQFSVDTKGINSFYLDDISLVKSNVAFAENFEKHEVVQESKPVSRPAGWNASGNNFGAQLSVSKNASWGAQSSSNSMLFIQGKGTKYIYSPTFPVIAGYSYDLSFKEMRSITLDQGAGYVSLCFVDKRGNVLSEETVLVKEATAENVAQWTEQTVGGMAPVNSVGAYIKVGQNCDAGDPYFGIDDMIVVETVGEILQPTGSLPMVENGDFSQSSTAWKGSLSVNEDGQAVIPAVATSAYFVTTNYITANAGEVLKLTAKAIRTSGDKDGYIGFYFYNEANQLVPENTAYLVRFAADEWTEIVLQQTVPKGAVKFKIEFGVNSGANTSFLVDDIKVEEDKTLSLSDNFNQYEKYEALAGKTNTISAGWSYDNAAQISCGIIAGKWGAADGGMLFIQAVNVANSPSFPVIPGLTYTVSYDEMDYAVATPETTKEVTKDVVDEETGETTTVTETVVVPAVANTGGYVQIVFVDADGNVVDSKKVAIKDDTVAQVWTSNSFEMVAPEGAVSACVKVGYEKVDGDAIFGIDNLKVTNNYVEDNTVVVPEYPEYSENFNDIATKYAQWTGDYEVTAAGMKINGTVYSDRFVVTAGNTYNIVAEGAETAIVWYNESGEIIEAEGNVAPEGAFNACVMLIGTDVVVASVAVYEEEAVTGPILTDVKIQNVALSLQDYIGMQIAVKKADMNGGVYDKAYLTYVQTPAEISDEVPVVSGTIEFNKAMGSYVGAEVQVMAWSMTDEITITVFYEVEGVTYQGQTITTSVKAKAMEQIQKNSATKDICIAMLNYGAAVQVAFNHCSANESSLANYDLTAEQKVVPSVEFGGEVVLPNGALKPATKSLSFGAKVLIQFPIKIADFSGYEVRYTIEGVDGEFTVPDEDIRVQGSFRGPSIAAKPLYMRSAYTIAIYDKATGEKVYGDIVCSIADLAKAHENKTYHNVASAMLAYGDAVDAIY